MQALSMRRFRRRALAVSVAALCLMGGVAAAGADTSEPVAGQAGAAEPASTNLVHCLLPGQVRRLGAFASSVTPRRAVRVSPTQCQASGGEYVESQDQSAAIKMWLPMASDGVPEAQTTVGELFDQRGDKSLARYWYEKAAAQGDARSL